MHQEKYNITWHTYSDHLKNMMKTLMMNEDYSDVTLVTEDKKHIRANINILSACSPVFRNTLKKEKGISPIMYLRGIQHSEMESIMQFIYLGEATFYEEKREEFFAVAKSLEIKELCNTETVTNDQPDDEPWIWDPVTPTKPMKEHNITTDSIPEQATQESSRKVLNANSTFDCNLCHSTYSSRWGLFNHKKSYHEGVQYACSQCDYKATQQINLTAHIQSKHEGVKFACDQCDYQAAHRSTLDGHIQSKHEGVKYACSQCDYLAIRKSHLTVHIQSKHESVKFACDQCDYQATQKCNLRTHIKKKH